MTLELIRASYSLPLTFFTPSLRSSGRKRELARDGNMRGVRVAPSCALVFSCAHYFQAPATQATLHPFTGFLRAGFHVND